MGMDKDAGDAAGAAAQEQAKLAKQLINQSDPLRIGLISDAGQFLRGGRDVSTLPEFAAAKSMGEQQFQRARESIIESTPVGGGLTEALAGLEGDRARSFTELSGALSSNEIDRALQLATFGAAQGSQGLSNAGFLQGQRAQAQAQQAAGKGEALGTVAGAAILK